MRGVSRSWGGHLRPQFTTYSLDLSGTCTDLLAIRDADEFGRERPGPGGIGLESMIQARSATPTLLLYGYSVQGSQVIFVREAAV